MISLLLSRRPATIGSVPPESHADTNASVGSEVIVYRTCGLADPGGQEREPVAAALHHLAQPITVGAEQLDPEDGGDLEDRPNPDCGRASLDIPQRDDRDIGSLSQGSLGPAPGSPGTRHFQVYDPDRVDRLR
jgi:hypothetical protein